MFEGDIKVCMLKAKVWVKVYFGIQALLVILIIGELSTPNWAYLDYDRKYKFDSNDGKFDASSFKGGIITCYEGCGSVITYRSFHDKYCDSDSYDDYDSDDDSYEDYSYDSYSRKTRLVCTMMDDLASFGTAKLIIDVITIVLIIAWAGTIILLKKNMKYQGLNLLCGLVSMLIFTAGTINWIARLQAASSDCGTVGLSSMQSVCMGDGPRLALAILVIYFISIVMFSWIIRLMHYKMIMKNISQGNLHSGPVTVGVAQPIGFTPQEFSTMPQPVLYAQPVAYTQPMYLQQGYLQVGHPQLEYPQSVHPQPAYPPTIYTQTGVVHNAFAPQENLVNNSYNPNVNESMIIKGDLNDETQLIADKKD